MDLQPVAKTLSRTYSIYRYPVIEYSTGPDTAENIITPAAQRLDCVSGGITNPVFIIPPMPNASNLYYSISLEVYAYLNAFNVNPTGVNNAFVPVKADCMYLGNSPIDNPITIDGQPLQQSFTFYTKELQIGNGSNISKIALPYIYGRFAINVSQLMTTPFFVGFWTDPSWEYRIIINPVVKASWL